jgi:hypothetical protein
MKYLFLIIASFSSSFNLFAQQKDVFEQIALQKRNENTDLEKNPALVLPNIVLKWHNKVQKAFKPGIKITTQSQLEEELMNMRKKYALFMRDLAPALPAMRKQTVLEKFSWRLIASEMTTDEKGNLYPLPGVLPITVENAWEEVSIPHYAGPINKAEAHYQKELSITAAQFASDKLFLHFNGVDYIADIYLNNKKVGDHIGLFGAFEFDIKPFVKPGKNLLEIKVFNDAIMMGDNLFAGPNRKFGKKLAACGGPGWNEPGLGRGWTMCPPGFGIWQRCYLETRSSAFINSIYVQPLLSESKAEVRVELPANAKEIQILYSLYGQNFKTTISEKKLAGSISTEEAYSNPGFTVYKFKINIPAKQLKRWSPDAPWLYQLQVRVLQKGKIVDAAKQQFGMRSFVQSDTSHPKGRFYLNGKEVKLRGANMMGNLMQCVIRKDFDQLRDDILLAKIAGMNFWRMTQQPCQQEVYDYFDKLGLMAQTDMPAFNGYRKDAIEEVEPQFVEMMRLVRNHPSNIIISYCNEPDFTKPTMLDRKGHQELFFRFDTVASKLHPEQVTKWIEGDYINISQKSSDHHDYDIWYGNSVRERYFGTWHSTHAGWMHSCGEFGAEGLDDIETMKKYYLKEWLKSEEDGTWKPANIPRCQTQTIGVKWLVLKTRTMEDWVSNSREYQMWATRLFTETLRRDVKMNSFAIHLLIDAWPAGWLKSIMDHKRKAKPAYFAYMDALKPIAVNLRPDSFYGFSGDSGSVAVFICNDKPETFVGGTLRYQVGFDKEILYTGSEKANAPASSPQFQGKLEIPIPQVTTRKILTVRVGLFGADGKLVHESSYDIEVFPSDSKDKQIENAGSYPQRLIVKQ